jgi:hypothetical protein
MNKITNSPEHRSHPLYPLLKDCIVAGSGGSTSKNLVRSWEIVGWVHQFEGFGTNMYSVESLSWKNQATYDKLVEIYS